MWLILFAICKSFKDITLAEIVFFIVMESVGWYFENAHSHDLCKTHTASASAVRAFLLSVAGILVHL